MKQVEILETAWISRGFAIRLWLPITVMSIIIFIFFWPAIFWAAEAELPSSPLSWQETVGELELEKMEQFKRQIDGEITGYLNDKTIVEWLRDFVKGQWKLNPMEIGRNLLSYLVREILANSHLLGKILVLAVISALLINLQASFEDQGVAKISSMACFLALSAIALGSFKYVLGIGLSAIDAMTSFMSSILPQMMLLITGLGHINTAAAMFPILMVACTSLANGIEKVVFPLIVFSAILNLLDCLSDTVKVQRMGKLVYTLTEIIMGLILTIFMSILTLRALYGSIMDAVTLRTGKFLTESFFPVIGGYLSEALETAASYVVLLKQAVGVFGTLMLFGLFIFPVLKIAVIALIYKVSAGLVEPLGDTRTSQALEIMGNHLVLVLAAVAAVGLMFLILVAIVGSIGNSVILVR